MKFSVVFLVALVASASAAAVKSELEVQLAKGFTDFLSGLLTDVLLPPLQQTIQTAAELAAQVTASLAIGGLPALQALLGKRDVDQRFIDALTQSLQQVITNVVAPALNTSLQQAALMAAQLVAGVAEGGLPALQSILSGLLG